MSGYRTNPIADDYKVESVVLGTGASGNVRTCISKKNGRKYALKILQDDSRSRNEVDLHWKASICKHIVKIVDIYENKWSGHKCLIVIMECMDGGELFDRIREQNQKGFTEREAAKIMKEIGEAIKFLHDHQIAHRDIKPENLLYSKDGTLKLTDFGFAKFTNTDKPTLETPCYTPYFAAPEILGNQKYNKACDMWSLGVIMYILIAGYPPFYSETGAQMSPNMKRKIKNGDYVLAPKVWDRVSPGARRLVERMLWKEPKERLTIQEFMRDHWIASYAKVPTTPLLSGDVLPNRSWTRAKVDLEDHLYRLRIQAEEHDAFDLGTAPSSLTLGMPADCNLGRRRSSASSHGSSGGRTPGSTTSSLDYPSFPVYREEH